MRLSRPASALAAAAILAGCGSSAAPPARARPPKAVTGLEACRRLRQDMLANGGQPDVPAVRRLAAEFPGSAGAGAYRQGLSGDLEQWVADQGGNPFTVAGDLDYIAQDCATVSVTLPGGTP